MRKPALIILNSIRRFWRKRSAPTLIELLGDNTALPRPSRKGRQARSGEVGAPEQWRKLTGEVNWGAGCPDHASMRLAA